jgi:hypothetical protein
MRARDGGWFDRAVGGHELRGELSMAMSLRWRCGVWTALSVTLGVLLAGPARVAAAPRVVAVDPPPETWIVDGTTLQHVELTFDVPVVVPPGAIAARTLRQGMIPVMNVNPVNTLSETVSATLPGFAADRVTLVVDFTVADEHGAALDGEVLNPRRPMLPTGDGATGGAAVFQFTILQGDLNRDGRVDITDFGAFQAALEVYNPAADFNADGVIDEIDEDVLLAGFGASLPGTDGASPTVVSVSPDEFPHPAPDIEVVFSEAMNPLTLSPRTVYAVGANGALVAASGAPMTMDNVHFIFPFADLLCQQNYTIHVSNQAADLSGRLLEVGAAHSL